MAGDITQSILDQIPDLLTPDGQGVDIEAIRSRLNQLDRQEVVLEIARYLHDNEALLPHMDFAFSVDDGRVYIDNDEVKISDEVQDPDEAYEKTEALMQTLDDMVDDDNEGFVNMLVDKLNKVKWQMPQAWAVLVDRVKLGAQLGGNQVNAADWLGLHRASWEAAEINQGLDDQQIAPAPSTPRARM